MTRKFSLILMLIIGLAPLSAQALGLGDIHLHSALNQNLDADIQLLSVEQGQLDNVKVKLASDDAFDRSGVDRTFLLTKLKFVPERKEDGSAVIRVTTREAVREPFLNFLIEVNWPKGRLVREYTVLLDPPVTLARKPAPVQAPEVSDVSPVETSQPKAEEYEGREVAPEEYSAGYTGGLDEVKVKNNDSLWVIARQLKHPGVGQYQMMMAIYHANPHAFYRNNVNRL